MSAKIQLRKTSLVDYPGRVSSVFFFPGCNLRCPWCHNRELVLGTAQDLIPLEEGLAHINKRKRVLGAVVLSGGEPCLYSGLGELIAEIKKTGLLVKLDTNGTFPAVLQQLFSSKETCPDYIAMDLKLAPKRYVELLPEKNNPGESAGALDPGEALIQSAALIRASGIIGKARFTYEYRSLALPNGFFTITDLADLAPLTDSAPWIFRPFRGGNCLDPAWDEIST